MKILRQRPNPPNIGQSYPVGCSTPLGQHVGIRVQPDDFLEQ
jgi:hypothetical protein